jgi:hypothetical protein
MGKEKKKKVKVKFNYCDYCEREIDNPGRKPLDEMEKTIIAIVFVSTIGVGILVSVILIAMLNPMSVWATLITFGVSILVYELYVKVLRRAIYCPTCETKLQFSTEAFMKPVGEPKTPKEQILAKVEDKKKSKEKPVKVEEEEEEIIVCPYCGHGLDGEYESCPYCKSML